MYLGDKVACSNTEVHGSHPNKQLPSRAKACDQALKTLIYLLCFQQLLRATSLLP